MLNYIANRLDNIYSDSLILSKIGVAFTEKKGTAKKGTWLFLLVIPVTSCLTM